MEPVARMIAAELSAKLEQPVAPGHVGAGDPPTRFASVARGRASAANAYATLREAGMVDAEARELAGLQ